jgi:hypothetical protein
MIRFICDPQRFVPASVAIWSISLVANFAFFLPPASGQGPPDPFAAYHTSLEHQLSGMLQNLQEKARIVQTREDGLQPGAIPAWFTSDAQGGFDLFARQFWGGRGTDLAAALSRLQAMRPTLENILQSEGLPGYLIGVVLVESAAQPFAQSPRRARGLWQLIPETARQYGLEVREGRDQRTETEAATHAAARYLRDLYGRFENWPLALAAYNAGQNAVEKALQGSKTATFWQLSSGRRLPEETRTYVPAVLAAMKLLGSDPLTRPSAEREPPPVFAPIAFSQAHTTHLFQNPEGRRTPAW